MADEQKTADVEVETPKTQENEVVLTQSKLDALIDKGFSKGAKRAETEVAKSLGVDDLEQARALIAAKRESDEAQKSDLDKANELNGTLNNTIEGLEGKLKSMEVDMAIQRTVAQNGINDADYFKHLLQQAAGSEDFEEGSFIESLKTEKPYLFNGGQVQAKRVDSSPNKAQLDVSERVKNATTMAELYALQNEIT